MIDEFFDAIPSRGGSLFGFAFALIIYSIVLSTLDLTTKLIMIGTIIGMMWCLAIGEEQMKIIERRLKK